MDRIDELIEESAPAERLSENVIDADFVDCGPDWTYIDFGEEEELGDTVTPDEHQESV